MDVKKLVAIAGVAVLIYGVIVYPSQLADAARATFSWATNTIEAVISFMRSVFA